MDRKTLYSISWLRAMAVIFILLCHLVVESPNAYINMLGQFFNVGVNIFILISGFLFGMKEIKNVKEWYIKRLKRIFIPFWIFLVILAFFTLLKNVHFSVIDWLLLILGLQGSNVGVLGAEHTWYISTMLMCYMLTPLISKAYEYIKDNKLYKKVIGVVLSIIPILFALFKSPSVYVLLSPIALYVFGFYLGKTLSPNKKHGKSIFYICLLGIWFIVRILSKLLFDGTTLYDRIFVFYTQSLIALTFLFLFINLFYNKKPNQIVKFIDQYSYEIYLVHYMFIVGPISLMNVTSNWFINSMIVIMTSILISAVLKYSTKIFSYIM